MKKLLLLLLCVPLIGFSQETGCISGNCWNGYGTYVFSNGQKYVGEWKDGEEQGQGVQTWGSNSKYDGGWKEGKRHGQGTYRMECGATYVGGFYEGEYHGKGSTTWSDGTYDKNCTYQYGEIYGERICYFANGTILMQNYKDGKRHGKQTYIYTNGSKEESLWENGIQIE